MMLPPIGVKELAGTADPVQTTTPSPGRWQLPPMLLVMAVTVMPPGGVQLKPATNFVGFSFAISTWYLPADSSSTRTVIENGTSIRTAGTAGVAAFAAAGKTTATTAASVRGFSQRTVGESGSTRDESASAKCSNATAL